MSVPPRSKDTDQTFSPADKNRDGNVDFREAIDKIKEINSQTDVFRDDLSKTGKDIAKIADIMKSYAVTKEPVSKEGEDDRPVQTNKICKVYGCIYKGTYEGIIDGLKKVAEDERSALDEEARLKKQHQLIKNMTIGMFDVNRSETVRLFRWIGKRFDKFKYDLDYDEQGQLDYQKKSYQLAVQEGYDKKKLLKTGNVFTQNEQMIGELAGIREAVGGGADRSIFKKDQTQIELLRRIAQGVGAQKRGLNLFWQQFRPKAMQNMSLYQITLLREISRNTEAFGKFQGGIFGFFKTRETQNDILRDIRRYLAPREKAQSKLWKTLNTPIFSLFDKNVKREKANIADLASGNEDIIKQIEHSNDYLEDITGILNKNLNMNKVQAIDGRKLLKKADTGLVTIPIDSTLTAFQLDSLKYAAGTEKYNREELYAIKDLEGALCDCITMSKGNDGLFRSMESTRQNALERGMDDEEERRDTLSRANSLQDTVENIYGLMVAQRTGGTIAEDSLIKKTFGKVAAVTGVLGDIAEVKQAVPWKKAQRIIFANDDQIVSLSEATMDAICKCFEKYADDDGIDLPGRKRKHRRPKALPTPKKKPGLIKKGAQVLKKGAKGIIPAVTGLGGAGGLLTATGSTIAGAGVGAMTTAAAGVAAAGAIGYGIGTLINKGIDKAVTKTTGGEAKSLGGLFYNLTHRKEVKEMRAQKLEAAKREQEAIKLKETEEKSNIVKLKEDLVGMVKLDRETDALNKKLSDVGMDTLPGYKESIAELKAEIAKLDAGTVVSQSMEIAKNLTTGSLSLAKDIVDKGFNIDWQDSINKGWQNSVKAMDELSDSVGVIAAVKESQTVGAIQQVYQDGKSVVTGGSSTTNIQVPVSAHDEERGTNLLVHSYGS